MDFGIANQIQAFSSCPNEMLWARHPHLTDQPAVDYCNPDMCNQHFVFHIILELVNGSLAFWHVVTRRGQMRFFLVTSRCQMRFGGKPLPNAKCQRRRTKGRR